MAKLTRKKAQETILAAGIYSNKKHVYPIWADLTEEQRDKIVSMGHSIKFKMPPKTGDDYGHVFYLNLLEAAGSPHRIVDDAFLLSRTIIEKMANAGATSVTDAEIHRCLANDPQEAMLTRAAKILAHADIIKAEDISWRTR